MSRWLLLTLAVAGCSPASRDLRPMVAVMVRYEVMAAADAPPAPAPDQKVQCKSCRGTGKVGDGRILSQCIPCNGTGFITCKDAEKCRSDTSP